MNTTDNLNYCDALNASGLALANAYDKIRQLERELAAARADSERLSNAVNSSCTCGGKPFDDPEMCPACAVWHHVVRARKSTP